MGEKRNMYRLLVRNTERRRPLGIPRQRWVYNIMMDFAVMDWAVQTELV
jgi:hypothetical protein